MGNSLRSNRLYQRRPIPTPPKSVDRTCSYELIASIQITKPFNQMKALRTRYASNSHRPRRLLSTPKIYAGRKFRHYLIYHLTTVGNGAIMPQDVDEQILLVTFNKKPQQTTQVSRLFYRLQYLSLAKPNDPPANSFGQKIITMKLKVAMSIFP